MEAVSTQWQRIEAHLQKLPQLQPPFFNPGATEEEIAAAETAMGGIRFPDDFRFSLLRHNGQAALYVLWTMGGLLSTEEIVSDWSSWKETLDSGAFADCDGITTPDAGVKADWWNPRWIPITSDGCGNHECLDLDPAEGGSVGQVIEMWHDDDMRPVLAPSFLAWLTEWATKLEDGSLVWELGTGFVAKEDAGDTTREATEVASVNGITPSPERA